MIDAQGTAFDGAAAFRTKITGAKSTKKFTLAWATAVANAITRGRCPIKHISNLRWPAGT